MNTRWSRFVKHPIASLVIQLVIFFLGLVVFSTLLKQLVPALLPDEQMARHIRGTCLFVIIFTFYFAVQRLVGRRRVSELQLSAMPRELLIGALVAASIVSMVILILYSLGAYTLYEFSVPDTVLYTVIWLPLLASIEELVFRGIIFRMLDEHYGVLIAYLISALIFGVMHGFNPGASVISVLSATLGGLLMCVLYRLKRRLWLPIGFHIGWNFTQAFFGSDVTGTSEFGYFFRAEFSGHELLIGHDGIETSLITISLIAILVVFGAMRVQRLDSRVRSHAQSSLTTS